MSETPGTSSPIDAHYGRASDIAAHIFAALRDSGKADEALNPADLAAFDQFHAGGIDATRDLASFGQITAGSTVIDLGGGLGGPARVLAHEFGARVTVVDITEAFVRAGKALTERLGLAQQVQFHLGDARTVPFAAGSFDFAWSQHATMNIVDKEGLFAEIYRLLRPGGRYVFHEIMAGAGGPIRFPVPWAADQSISDLRPPDEIRRMLRSDLSLVEISWQDVSRDAQAWFAASQERMRTGAQPPAAAGLIFGAEFPTRIANLSRNLDEDRVRVIRAVFEKPAGA